MRGQSAGRRHQRRLAGYCKGWARPVSHHDLPFGSRADRLADFDLRGQGDVGDIGAVRDAVVVICPARAGTGMAKILEQPATARLQRSDGLDQAPRFEGGRQPSDLHGQPSLLQGGARQAAHRGRGGMTAQFEPIVGRYMHLDLFGRKHRLYVEEAGEGTPLLCLHTAGADGRQYRALMNDERVTRRHRVIAFDMPWHGKSSPPSGWHNEEYQLTSAQYTTMILDIITALELDRPILIGCSIGGRIALHLALEHPERFRAIIGLQAGAHVDPYYDLNFLHRPDVHGGEVSATIVSGLVGSDAPDAERWETLWHYMQGGPGVFKGDLYFYKLDGDIRGRVAQIDTSRCPLFLLSGEYDYSCTPEETLAVANSIPGSEVTIMKGLGHFPMSEDPQAFLTHLLPVLEKIRR